MKPYTVVGFHDPADPLASLTVLHLHALDGQDAMSCACLHDPKATWIAIFEGHHDDCYIPEDPDA